MRAGKSSDGAARMTAASSSETESSPTIDAAFDKAVVVHRLEEFGFNVAQYHIGSTLHVDSLAEEMPPFTLAEIRVGSELRGIAMFEETRGGYRFGAVARTDPYGRLPVLSELDEDLRRYGLEGPARPVWTLTLDDTNPMFVPMLQGTDTTTGQPAYVTAEGRRETLRLVDGLTLRDP
jgi:hypothetical protein